jgi:hypothetical protein
LGRHRDTRGASPLSPRAVPSIQLSKSPVAPADLKNGSASLIPRAQRDIPCSPGAIPRLSRSSFRVSDHIPSPARLIPSREREARTRSMAFPALPTSHQRGNGPFPGPRIVHGTGNRTCTALISCTFMGNLWFPLGNVPRSLGNEPFPRLPQPFPPGNVSRFLGKSSEDPTASRSILLGRRPEKLAHTIAGLLTSRSLGTNVCTSLSFVQRPLESIEVSHREDLGIPRIEGLRRRTER